MGEQRRNDSVEIKDVNPEESAELMKMYTGEKTGFIRLGPKGYLMPQTYKGMADQLYNLPLRDDDVFIVTYPRSGTTMTQELIWLVANNLDYETAAQIHLTRRFPFIEFLSMIHPEFEKELFAKNSHIPENVRFLKSFLEPRTDIVARMASPRFIKTHMPLSLLPPRLLDKTKVVYVARDPRDVAVSYYYLSKQLNFAKNSHIPENVRFLKSFLEPRTDIVARMASPRFIKTHMPLSLLPPRLLDKTKVVYVARDPRDVAVSYYYLSKQLNAVGFTGDFKDFWSLFIKKLVNRSPFFEHLKEAWDLRHHPNLVFLFYEDLVKDLSSGIRCICKLLGKQYSEQDVQRLCEHLNIENFRKNKSVNLSFDIIGFTSETFTLVRKGKSGGWRDHFDEKMTLEAERWMEENLRNTDMRFPQH